MKINIKQIFSKNEDKHKIYHLSEFLIEKIFLTYLVIFVLITSLQLIIEYHSEKNNVKKTLNTFIDSNLQEIDKAIFSNDKLLLSHILEQISNKNEVSQIILIDTNNKKQFSWKFENLKSSSGDIVIRKTLVYNQIPLGTLIISSSNSIIIGKLIDIYVKILFTNLIIFISLVVVMMLALLGQWLINLLYGNAYQDAYELIVILGLATLCSGLGTVAARLMVKEESYRYISRKMMCVAITSLPISYIMIYLFELKGAAYSVLIIELLSLTFFNYFYKNGLIFKIHFFPFFKNSLKSKY